MEYAIDSADFTALGKSFICWLYTRSYNIAGLSIKYYGPVYCVTFSSLYVVRLRSSSGMLDIQ